MTASTPLAISRYRLCCLRVGIKLEIKGMSHSRGRWFTTNMARSELGLSSKVKPPEVLAALEAHIASLDEFVTRINNTILS